MDRFDGIDTQVLGISVDSDPCLVAWADSLGGITYPLLSDFYPHGEVAIKYGVLRSEGKSERAIFVIDKQGIIRYVDVHDIDDQPDNDELFRVLSEIEGRPVPGVTDVEPAAPEDEAAYEEPADVVMYCTPWCPACRRARAFFKMYDIEIVEIDITRDRAAAQRVRGWADGNETTPTFNVKGTVIVNFNRQKLMEVLEIEEE